MYRWAACAQRCEKSECNIIAQTGIRGTNMESTSIIAFIIGIIALGIIVFFAVLIPLLSSKGLTRRAEESIERSKISIEHSWEMSKRNIELAEQTLEVRKEILQTQKETNSLLRELISKIEQK